MMDLWLLGRESSDLKPPGLFRWLIERPTRRRSTGSVEKLPITVPCGGKSAHAACTTAEFATPC